MSEELLLYVVAVKGFILWNVGLLLVKLMMFIIIFTIHMTLNEEFVFSNSIRLKLVIYWTVLRWMNELS